MQRKQGGTAIRYTVRIKGRTSFLYEDEGKPKIDIEAINQARTVFLCLSKKYPIVTIDVDGNTRIYKDTEAMANEMGKKPKNIQGGVWAYQKYGNLVVLKLSEVVKRENGKVLFNEDGSFMLDEAKILEYRDAILLKK